MDNNIRFDEQLPVREKYIPCAMCDLLPENVLPHFHDALEIIFTTKGAGTAICNGVEYRHTAGSVFFASSNEVHCFIARTDDIDGLVVDVEPNILLGAATQFQQEMPSCHIWEDPKMESKLWEIVEFISRHYKEMDQKARIALVSSLLTLLLDHVELKKAAPASNTVAQIVNYCQEHCTEPISLEVLAKEFSLNPSHVSRIFSKKLKISFSDYINGLRLSAAINLLTTSKISVTKAATYAGFPTIRTFNRVFMEQYGMTPSQYRAMNKSKKDTSE